MMNKITLKILLAILLLVIETALPVYAESVDTSIPPTVKRLRLETSELAGKFHVLDQISGALPNFFQIPEYKDLLKKQLKHDTNLLSSYRAIRVKYQKIPAAFDEPKENCSGLFAPSLVEFQDPICDVFFTSSSLNEALLMLKEKLTVSE